MPCRSPMIALGLALSLAACEPHKATFEPGPCQFPLALGIERGRNITCGDLIVPQDWSRPDSAQIRLHIGIQPARTPSGAQDAVVLLTGGPGQGGVVLPNPYDRDLIAISQRGTAFDTPWLDCEQELSAAGAGAKSTHEAVDALIQARLDCKRRLEQQGGTVIEGPPSTTPGHGMMMAQELDLAAYNTNANAADIEALRRTLGYKQLDLIGVSYGSLLAQYIMRARPDTIRAVILDSVWPTSRSLIAELGASLQLAINKVTSTCDADSGCRQRHPELAKTVTGMLAQYAQSPLRLNPPSGPLTLDSDLIVNLLHNLLFDGASVARIPEIIEIFARRDPRELEQLLGTPMMAEMMEVQRMRPSGFEVSEGMHTSVLCSDDVQYITQSDVIAAMDRVHALPALQSYFSERAREFFATCAAWPRRPADPEAKTGVHTKIPLLAFNGRFDPNTPAEWADQVARAQSAGHAIELPSGGHSAWIRSSCAQAMTTAFIADPNHMPSSDCLQTEQLQLQ